MPRAAPLHLLLALAGCVRFEGNAVEPGDGLQGGDWGPGCGILQLSASGNGGCVLAADGGVWCWGESGFGQLGTGSLAASAVPVQPLLLEPAFFINNAEWHTCAVSTARLSCWGGNGSGQVGDGTQDQRLTPVPNDMVGAVEVRAGQTHTCARTSTGEVWCWGSNADGAVGNSDLSPRLDPTQVPLIDDARAIAVGDGISCAIRSDATLWCWGTNAQGRLGDGSPDVYRYTPGPVATLEEVVQVSGGCHGHLCAVTADGLAWCWGDGSRGQLGYGQDLNRDTPARVALPVAVDAVAVGGMHSCALARDGGVWCWGRSQYGELGNGGGAPQLTPIEVSGLPAPALQVEAGCAHTCALLADGDVWCWGLNDEGAVGDGTFDPRTTPTRSLACDYVRGL